MKTTLALSFTCLLISLIPLSAQESATSDSLRLDWTDTVRVNPGLEYYFIRLVVPSLPEKAPMDEYEAARIEVSSELHPSPFQIIRNAETGIYDTGFIDVNFDGYLDLQVIEPMAASGVNEPCSFWLFNPSTGRFDEDPEFAFNNVTIDPATRTISTNSNWGDRRYNGSNEHYTVVNNRLKQLSAGYSDCDKSYQKALVNDSLVIVRRMFSILGKDSLGRALTVHIFEELHGGQLVKVRQEAIRHIPENSPEYSVHLERDCYGWYVVVSDERYPVGEK